jgi:hypothetical protein
MMRSAGGREIEEKTGQRSKVSILLRIAAGLSWVWAALLLAGDPYSAHAVGSAGAALAQSLGIAQLVLGYIFWRAAADPARERGTLYAALLLFGLRAAGGTYQVLYVVEGKVAVTALVDMVTSIALFVGILNALPGTLGHATAKRD